MNKPTEPPLEGGCQCGALRYRINAAPQTLYACHCLECQHQAASVHGLSTWVNYTDFEVLRGEPVFYLTQGGSGAAKSCAYCGDCGTRIYHRGGASAGRDENIEGEDGVISLKAGSLDDTSWFYPIAHLWTIRTQPWMRQLIESADYGDRPRPVMFEREPDDDEALIELWNQYLETCNEQ